MNKEDNKDVLLFFWLVFVVHAIAYAFLGLLIWLFDWY